MRNSGLNTDGQTETHDTIALVELRFAAKISEQLNKLYVMLAVLVEV